MEQLKHSSIFGGRLGAVCLMVLASAAIALASLFAKSLGLTGQGDVGLHPFQVSAGRFVFAFLALLLLVGFAPSRRPSFVGANWCLHLARVLCGWLAVSALFAAVARMPVVEASAISLLSPIVTVAFAVLLLNERVGVRKLIAGGLAVAGAVLILNPGGDAFQTAGLLALASAFFMGLEAISIKLLSDTEPALRVLIINNAIGALVSLSIALFFWVSPTYSQWIQLVALGVVMVSGQALFLQSMKRGEASQVIPVYYSFLIFVALYDFLLYSVVPGLRAVIGAALVVSAAVLLALR